MDLLDRLKLLMEKSNETNASLARNSGVPYTTIDGLFKKGYKNAYVSTIQKLSDYFRVSLDYLVYGGNGMSDDAQIIASKYDMLDAAGKHLIEIVIDHETERVREEEASLRQRRARKDETSRVIPFRRSVQSASAGTGTYLGPEEFETILVEENDLTRRASFGVPVSGDSMEPLYHDGDLLVIEAAEELRVGEIGVFTIDGEGYVKKLGKNALISLNPAYAPIRLTEDTRCNGRVIGVLDPDWIVER